MTEQGTKNYALVKNNKVVNVAVWDGKNNYKPDGKLIELDGENVVASIGWDYKNGVFTNPNPIIFEEEVIEEELTDETK